VVRVGVSVKPKNFKKRMMLNWNFQRSGSSQTKISFMGEVRASVLSGTSHGEVVYFFYSN